MNVPTALGVARNVDAGDYLEAFLVAAVGTVLGIRVFLEVTGYPQIGGGGLHVAHLLWGGLLMLVALVLLLGFVGKRAEWAAAVVGGAGFGAFVDELGKFITADNDYFYRPTAALLYVLFVVLFLAFRQVGRRQAPDGAAALANAVDLAMEVVLRPGTTAAARAAAEALALLDQSGARGSVADGVRLLVAGAAGLETRPGQPGAGGRALRGVRTTYERFLSWRWFGRIIIVVFVLDALDGITAGVSALTNVAGGGPPGDEAWGPGIPELAARLGDPVAAWGAVLASLLTAACTVVGAVYLPRNRPAGLRWFRRTALLSILLVQPFHFLDEQFGAVVGLALNIVLLGGLNAMLHSATLAAARHGRGAEAQHRADQLVP